MNNDYVFLENLYQLLEQGYGIEETLLICRDITHHPSIDSIMNRIMNGDPFSEALKDEQLPKEFLEFYDFFSRKFKISDAIKNSIHICQRLRQIKSKLVSQLTYPLILIIFLIVFSMFATFILFPKVDQLFTSFSIEQSMVFKILFTVMRFVPLFLLSISFLMSIFSIYFFLSLRKKRYLVIEKYLRIPFLKKYIQKYFTLKFAIYFNELLRDQVDTNAIIGILNNQMNRSDIKIMIYEIYTKLNDGYSFDQIIDDFDYFDHLFVSMYKMYLRSPKEIGSMQGYIDISYHQIEVFISRLIQIFVPVVYGFVAFFVIMIYIAIILPMMNVIGEI